MMPSRLSFYQSIGSGPFRSLPRSPMSWCSRSLVSAPMRPAGTSSDGPGSQPSEVRGDQKSGPAGPPSQGSPCRATEKRSCSVAIRPGGEPRHDQKGKHS